jgi:transketolase
VALSRRDAPTALILSRQGLRTLPGPLPVERGAYVLEDGDDCILIATGSEVGVALEARGVLKGDGISARVVSMPSFELFREQERGYRDEVLPPAMTARVAVEAASPFGWAEWVGNEGAVVAIARFGASAPGAEALAALGITPRAVAEAARAQVGR